MGLNLPLLKDAVARWETYRDRGVAPAHGWNVGPDGEACALGDIAHYSGLNGRDVREWRVGKLLGIEQKRFGNTCLPIAEFDEAGPYMPLAVISDQGRWPVEEVRRLIAWEEASLGITPRSLGVDGDIEFPAIHEVMGSWQAVEAEKAEERA